MLSVGSGIGNVQRSHHCRGSRHTLLGPHDRVGVGTLVVRHRILIQKILNLNY